MDWMNIGFAISSSIIISIPEESFIVFLTLFILGKFDSIKLKAYNLPKFAICVLPAAFFSNFMRLLLPQMDNYLLAFGIFIVFMLVVFTYKLSATKDILRCFVATCLSFLAMMIFQISYAPLLIFGTGYSIQEINNSIPLGFLWTLPERAMEYSMLILLMARKNMATKLNIFSILSKNRFIASITLFLLLFNVAFLAVMAKLICFNNILAHTSLLNVVLIVALVVIFPIMNISLLMVVIYSIYYRYSIRLLLSKERINTLINVLAIYAEEKNYGKIDNVVNDLHNQVDIL